MENEILKLCDRYGVVNGRLVAYKGGYPIVEFEMSTDKQIHNKSQKELDKIVRKAEIKAGRELGVGFNFRKTAFIKLENNKIVIGGHINIVEEVVRELFHK